MKYSSTSMSDRFRGHKNDEVMIAHRGLCSIFPENTLPALTAALICCNYAETDLQLTKDNKVIVFHDRGLKRITNVTQFNEFANRNKKLAINSNHKPTDDFWVRDFTLQELKKLTVFQDNPKRPQFHSYTFQIITLEQLIKQYIQMRNQYQSECGGLLIEIKEQVAKSITDRDRVLCEEIGRLLQLYGLQTPASSVILQSFQIQTLDMIPTDNLRVQLFDKDVEITEQLLSSKWQSNVIGIGITQNNLLNVSQTGGKNSSLKQICDKFNYEIFYWTLINDDLGNIPMKQQNYRDVCWKLKEEGVTGFITEFPLCCKEYFGKQVRQLSEILDKCRLSDFLPQLDTFTATVTQ